MIGFVHRGLCVSLTQSSLHQLAFLREWLFAWWLRLVPETGRRAAAPQVAFECRRGLLLMPQECCSHDFELLAPDFLLGAKIPSGRLRVLIGRGNAARSSMPTLVGEA
jgi:hypothetical protein